MKVRSPDEQTWRVSRRWVPWRRRLKGMSGPDVATYFPGIDDPIAAVLSLIMLVVLLPALVIMVFAILELLVLVALFPLALLIRVLFARRWHIEVRRGFTPWWEQQSGGWRASRAAIHEVAQQISEGQVPPRTLSAEP